MVTQRTCPSHAICGEVRKEGRTGGERHLVSSKTEGPETLGALRRERGSPWLCSPIACFWSFLCTDRHSPGLGFPPTPTPPPAVLQKHFPQCLPAAHLLRAAEAPSSPTVSWSSRVTAATCSTGAELGGLGLGLNRRSRVCCNRVCDSVCTST